jgi:hypothetical protein
MATGTGRTLSYFPTTTGIYTVTATNPLKECGSQSTTLTYKVKNTLFLNAGESDGQIDIAIVGREDSQSAQTQFASGAYTLELWNSIYGLMRTKVVQSATEQMSTAGLPQGVYVILLKENGNVIAETKVIIQ